MWLTLEQDLCCFQKVCFLHNNNVYLEGLNFDRIGAWKERRLEAISND